MLGLEASQAPERLESSPEQVEAAVLASSPAQEAVPAREAVEASLAAAAEEAAPWGSPGAQ